MSTLMPAAASIPHPLTPFLNPRSIAIIGVRGGVFDPAARNSMARRFVENLLRHGYPGAIYPVHPRFDSVAGLPCYPSVSAIPGAVDAALLIVPKDKVAAALADCAAKGVKAVTVISSGYAETGAAGRADEAALVGFARSHGMRLTGPNCYGYFNSHGRVNLFGSPSLLTRPLLNGHIGFVAQSGAIAGAILDRAQERGIGFSCMLTTGNQADIDNVDCIEYLIDDANTRVIALFAEAIGDAKRFRAAVQRAARAGKPCVVLKTGASEVARQSALAHTGSLVGDDAVFDAAFRQDGVVRVHDPDELFLTAALLAHAGDAMVPAPAGHAAAVALMSTSGAMGGILADGAARHGVQLADLTEATRAALQAIPGISGGVNPLDVAMATFAADFSVVGQLAALLAADPNTGIVLLAVSGLPYAERLVDDCAAAVLGTGKLFIPMWAGDHADLALAVPRLAQRGVTVFETCDSALRAIGALTQVRRHQAQSQEQLGATARATARATAPAAPAAPASRATHAAPQRIAAARALLARCASGNRALTEHHSKQLLALYGIAIAPEEIASDAAAAVHAAARIGYPVALKIDSPDIVHKTEAGGLKLALGDAAAVRAAFAAVMRNAAAHQPQARLDGVLVTPMAAPGIEMVIGATTDPHFGPVLLAGLGGVLVEVLRDTALRVAPLTERDAHAMLAELRGAPLLRGVRGQGPANQAAIVQVLLALSALMQELGEWISAVDINPLIVHPLGHTPGPGTTVADALVVLKPVATLPAKDTVSTTSPNPAPA